MPIMISLHDRLQQLYDGIPWIYRLGADNRWFFPPDDMLDDLVASALLVVEQYSRQDINTEHTYVTDSTDVPPLYRRIVKLAIDAWLREDLLRNWDNIPWEDQ